MYLDTMKNNVSEGVEDSIITNQIVDKMNMATNFLRNEFVRQIFQNFRIDLTDRWQIELQL
jgi:hypothetical protein